MKVLFKILLLAGVVMVGFHQSRAGSLTGDKDKDKEKSTFSDNANEHSQEEDEGEKHKPDSVIGNDVQVGDTLVFDDYDEDDSGSDEGLIAVFTPIESISGMEAVATDHNAPEDQVAVVTSDNIPAGKQLNSLNSSDSIRNDNTENYQEVDCPCEFEKELKIFPNPATAFTDVIHIENDMTGEVSMLLIDMSGKVVDQRTFESKQLDITAPAAGMYTLILTGNNTKKTARLSVR